jgi:hypothetical protein
MTSILPRGHRRRADAGNERTTLALNLHYRELAIVFAGGLQRKSPAAQRCAAGLFTIGG